MVLYKNPTPVPVVSDFIPARSFCPLFFSFTLYLLTEKHGQAKQTTDAAATTVLKIKKR